MLINAELSLFVLTLWGIWEAHYRRLYENVKVVPSLVIAQIEGMFQSFVYVQIVNESYKQPIGVLSIEK